MASQYLQRLFAHIRRNILIHRESREFPSTANKPRGSIGGKSHLTESAIAKLDASPGRTRLHGLDAKLLHTELRWPYAFKQAYPAVAPESRATTLSAPNEE